MWDGKVIKIIPPVLFLFCLLEIFELGLAIGYIGKIEKLEDKIIDNLKASEDITILLNKHLIGMSLKYSKDKNK